MHLFALMGFFLLSGAPVVSSAPAAPVEQEVPSHTVTLTAYNAVPAQTDSDPFETASGLYSNPETVAARSQDLAEKFPFGTIIEIDAPTASGNTCGYSVVAPLVGYRIIADTMNVRYTDRIDILFNTKSNFTFANGNVKNASTVLGICEGATVRAVGYIDLTKTNRIPKTQADLAALVRGESDLALK